MKKKIIILTEYKIETEYPIPPHIYPSPPPLRDVLSPRLESKIYAIFSPIRNPSPLPVYHYPCPYAPLSLRPCAVMLLCPYARTSLRPYASLSLRSYAPMLPCPYAPTSLCSPVPTPLLLDPFPSRSSTFPPLSITTAHLLSMIGPFV